MSVVRYRAGILGTLLLGGVFPLVGSLLAYRLLPQWRWPNVELPHERGTRWTMPLHECRSVHRRE